MYEYRYKTKKQTVWAKVVPFKFVFWVNSREHQEILEVTGKQMIPLFYGIQHDFLEVLTF